MASSVWRGNIAFGLVSIPVRLVRAARRERTKFRHVYRPEPEAEPETEVRDEAPAFESHAAEEVEPVSTAAPVQRVHHVAVATNADMGSGAERLKPSEILKGFEVEPNRYVTFKAEEVKAAKPQTSTTVEIASFIHVAEVDSLYFDASYYVVPLPAGEKPYAVLFGSLQKTGYAALGQMAMHGREHSIVMRTGAKGLVLETLFFQNEVHLEDQHAVDPALATASELKMGESFIKALAAPFNPEELVDQYEKRLKALIESRAGAASAGPDTKPREAAASAVDIMEALRKSLDLIRKPAAKETSPKRRRAS